MATKTAEIGEDLKEQLAQLADRAREAGVMFVGVLGIWDVDCGAADFATVLQLAEGACVSPDHQVLDALSEITVEWGDLAHPELADRV